MRIRRKIIKIDEERCNGCGLCAQACHEGAIGMVDGKAKLLRDDYCDGLGDCLPACPMEAISFEEREADAYDEAAVKARQAEQPSQTVPPLACGCPGTHAKSLSPKASPTASFAAESQLSQWPVQIQLVSPQAPYLQNCDLLIAADCTAYAYGDFHSRFIKGRITLVGCPKLDSVDYTEKLTAILALNTIQSVTMVRMEVPCCGGLEHAVRQAVKNSGKSIPLEVVTISTSGEML